MQNSTRRYRLIVFGVAAVLSLSGSICPTEPDPPVPTTIIVVPTTLALDAIGETKTISATVKDQNDSTLTGVAIVWSTDNGAVAAVGSASGTVTAVGNGTAMVKATVGNATASVTVTVQQVATQLSSVSGDGQVATVGQLLAESLVVKADDKLGNAAPGVTVNFAVTQGGGSMSSASSTTGADGQASSQWTLGTSATANQVVTVSLPALAPASVAFSATANPDVPDSLAQVSGDNQTGLINSALPESLVVQVVDQFGNVVSATPVSFAVIAGGGSVNPTIVTADTNGEAVTYWTLGGSGVDTATATVTGLTPVAFAAIGVNSLFNIEVRYVPGTTPTPTQAQAFTNASIRWSTLVIGDLADIFVDTQGPFNCAGINLPGVNETIDDVLILTELTAIDGVGGILGGATWCVPRPSDGLPFLGVMIFDTADLPTLEASGALGGVILHEMGHVLGFGSLWEAFGLLADPSLQGGTDPHFTGVQAIAAFDSIGGTGYTGGNKVPVETMGGQGTADAHWRESVFTVELMTGFLSLGVENPLSVVSVASLADLGYVVDVTQSDPFSLTFPFQVAGPSRKLHLKDDILRGPQYVIEADGRMRRVR